MPDNYLGSYSIGGFETNGVTFVVNDMYYDEDEYLLRINVMQIPNDDYSTIVDNQLDDPDARSDLDNQMEQASQRGGKLIGTLCDILRITDAKGNKLLNEYSVSFDPNENCIFNEFCIYFSPENTIEQVDVILIFGVNENLNSLFPMSESMNLSIDLKTCTVTIT